MAKKSKSVAGMDIAVMDAVQSLNQYGDILTLMPNKHRMWMKALGPLYTTVMKMEMAWKSLTKTLGVSEESLGEVADTAKEGEKTLDSSLGAMAFTTGILTATFAPLGKVLGVVKGAFMGVLMGILPLMGIMFGVMGAVMLLVAVFDKGGGALRKWLEDLPLIGDAFGFVQAAVDKVRGVFGGLGVNMDTIKTKIGEVGGYIQEMFGPALAAIFDGLSATFDATVGRVSALWETLKSTVSLPELDGEGMLSTISTTLAGIVEVFFEAYNMVQDAVFGLITAMAESGMIQGILDGIMGIYNGFVTAWDAFTAILGDGEIMGFFEFVMDLWAGLIDFLVSSGIFAFIGELFAFIGELIGFVVIVAAVIIAVVIKIVAFVYPYIAPYAKYFIAWFGIAVTLIMGVVRIVMAYVRFFMALLTGDLQGAADQIKSMGGIIMDVGQGVWKYIKMLINSLIDLFWNPFKLFNAAIRTFNKIPGVFNIPEIPKPAYRMAMGGIASGPSGGYPVELHGTEAVVPLPDGKSIPVTMRGGGGTGGETTININVSGAHGDPRKIARMVGEEVGRLFKSRSRGSGFSRGV